MIADLLKQYLRELREPLIAVELVDNWPKERWIAWNIPLNKVKIFQSFSIGIKILFFLRPSIDDARELIDKFLPEANRMNFLLFLQFLHKVVKVSNVSKMPPDNLALVLWMSLCPQRYALNLAILVFAIELIHPFLLPIGVSKSRPKLSNISSHMPINSSKAGVS